MSVQPVRGAQCGFTLLEILVVLLVIAIASALLYPRLDPSPARTLQRDAARLSAALESTARLAQWRGTTMAVSLESGGFHVWERDQGDSRWVAANDESIGPREFDPATTLSTLSVGAMTVAPGTLIVFRPSGRNEPVSVVLTTAGASARLRTDIMNRVALSISAGG